MWKAILFIYLLTATCFAGVIDEKVLRGGRIAGFVFR
jgi:hypothetical protein